MSEHKFTKGPWFRDKYGNVVTMNGDSIRLRSITICCAGTNQRVDEAEANTDLIAAAPDLLTALEETHAALCFMDIDAEPGKAYMGSERWKKNREAIDKAMGAE